MATAIVNATRGQMVQRLAESGLVTADGKTVKLTARGRLLSNEVFQEFLEANQEADQ